jgi:replicative DNA helicase
MIALTPAEMFEHWATAEPVRTIPTGFPSLDKALGGGLALGAFTALLGDTGVGKSELARHIGLHVANSGGSVAHLDLELGHDEIVMRELAQRASVPFGRVRSKLYSKEEWARIDAVRSAICNDGRRLIAVPENPPSLLVLGKSIEAMLLALGTSDRRLVIIDSLQRFSEGLPGDDPRRQVTQLLHWCERFARRHGVAMLITSEMKRIAEEDITPYAIKHSGAESRAIEFAAYAMLALVPHKSAQKAHAVDADAQGERFTRLMVAKNRSGTEGWLPAMIKSTRPYWQMEEAATVAAGNPLQERRALAILKPGRMYKPAELATAWKLPNSIAKNMRDKFVEDGALQESDGLFFLLSEEKKVDTESVPG